MLFRSGEFGNENPEALQRTVWWLLALHFGFRARDKSRKLKWGDIVLQEDNETGNKILIWKSERGSETRCDNGDTRAFNPTPQATNNKRCPVYYYKKFKSHCPEEMNNADSPFYLTINHRRRPGNSIWYMKAPLGKNEIGKLMKTAAQAAGLQGNITNHSVQKTCISCLMDAEVPVNYVAQLSGHRNLKKLRFLPKAASVEHQRKMSLTLSRSGEHCAQSSTVSSLHESSTFPVNPKDVNKPGVFSGACIGKIEGCSFTFNIHREKEESPKSAKPKKRRIIISDDSDSD